MGTVQKSRGSKSPNISIGNPNYNSNSQTGLIIASALVLALGGAWGLGLSIKLNSQGITISVPQQPLTK